jgi:RTA1 like protein
MTDSATSDPILYHYVPSLAAATVFCVPFSLSTILHFNLLLTTRAWYMIPLLLGGLYEAIGYAGRIIGSTESPDYSLAPYILQSILLLITLALIAASIYMILGYIILAIDGERHSIIREKFLTKIFVIGDIFSFMVQSAGMFPMVALHLSW